MQNKQLVKFDDKLILQVFDVSSTLYNLLSFLVQYDNKFEKFHNVSNVNLTDKDENCFNLALSDCKKMSIDKLPSIQEFIQITINKGGSPELNDFTIKSLLKNYLLKEKNTINAIIAYKILNHPDYNKNSN